MTPIEYIVTVLAIVVITVFTCSLVAYSDMRRERKEQNEREKTAD